MAEDTDSFDFDLVRDMFRKQGRASAKIAKAPPKGSEKFFIQLNKQIENFEKLRAENPNPTVFSKTSWVQWSELHSVYSVRAGSPALDIELLDPSKPATVGKAANHVRFLTANTPDEVVFLFEAIRRFAKKEGELLWYNVVMKYGDLDERMAAERVMGKGSGRSEMRVRDRTPSTRDPDKPKRKYTRKPKPEQG